MRATRTNLTTHLSARVTEGTTYGGFLVPGEGRALLIRNGVPEQYCPPGHHVLPPGRGKVEVRLLSEDITRQPVLAPPDFRALALPYERSYLFVDGDLVGTLTTPSSPRGGGLRTWEGFQPVRGSGERPAEPLKTCLTERLRSCLPSAGVCCGARIPG